MNILPYHYQDNGYQLEKMMSFLAIFGLGLIVILVYMTLIWLISLPLKNASIVDIFWGTGFLVAAFTYFALTGEGYAARKVLLLVLVAVWGVRLSLHIFVRNRGKGEDFRYQNWRKQRGDSYWWYSYLQVFLLQGVILWFVSAPLLAAQFPALPSHLTILDVVGTGVWFGGFFFEAVGDWQLTRFKGNPANKGKVMRTGLWKYTRHPNYFGDAMVWWGYFLIALSTPGGFLTLLSPVLMTLLLLRVSGVALLERSLIKAKPGYQEYVETTSGFFPWPPKKLR